METIDQITEAVKYYQAKNETLSGDLLLYTQDKISTNLYYLSDIVADAYKSYLQAKLDRKMGVLDKTESYLAEEMNKTNAGMRAEKESRELYKKENEAEAYYKRVKMYLDTAQDVIQAIRQRVSQLKKEKSNACTQS